MDTCLHINRMIIRRNGQFSHSESSRIDHPYAMAIQTADSYAAFTAGDTSGGIGKSHARTSVLQSAGAIALGLESIGIHCFDGILIPAFID